MNDAKTCGTCEHWGYEEDTNEFRPCQAVVHDRAFAVGKYDDPPKDPDSWSEGYLAELTPDERAKAVKQDDDIKAELAAIRKHLAVVQDGSGYYAALKTREDFGCVLWKLCSTAT